MSYNYNVTGYHFMPLLPKGWEMKSGRFCFEENKEKNADLSEKCLLQFTYGSIVRKKIQDIPQEDEDIYKKYKVVKPNDIMLNGLNLNYDFVSQRVGLVNEKGIITSAYLSLRCHDIFLPTYATYLLKSLDAQKIFHGMGSGVRLTLGYSEFSKLQFPVPPRDEQDQIVRYLNWKVSQINKLIHGYQRQIKLLEERKKRIINDICSHGIRETSLVDSGIDWLGFIPRDWRLIRIRNNYDLQNGISESGDFFEKGTPFVNYGDVYKNRILPTTVMGVANSNEQQQKTYSVKKGDIFFTRTSETIDEIGFASICLKDIEKAVFSGFLIRARAKSNMLIPEYMGYYLQTQHVRDFFTKEMNLVTRASLGQTLLKSLYVPVPSIEEQAEIVAYLNLIKEKYDNAISAVEKQMLLFKEYRTRLISDVVTGQKDVRDIIIPEYEAETDDIESDNTADSEDMESGVSSDE